MRLTSAEKSARHYARHRERVKARARAWYAANREQCRLKRQTPEFRAKRAEYMRVWVLANKIFEEWRFATWAADRWLGYREQEAAA